MALASTSAPYRSRQQPHFLKQVVCRRKEKDRDRDQHFPFKVVEITPPPKSLGVRCFPTVRILLPPPFRRPNEILSLEKFDSSTPPSSSTMGGDLVVETGEQVTEILSLHFLYLKQNIHCGESVTIEGRAYTVSAVTHRYQLRKGKYEPSEKRLDVQSTGRYILNLYLENLLDKS
ncbi:hypothetical protein ACMD2_26873 [Ananas comosus]|uniref:Uncharacterized protein n=1 Tax=Ananas comosus TaxID=4615 RepID=A0A199VKI5_ANACO|nr:hypothetical protein ACMD2_26873 [Ananas comosus]